MYSIFYLEKFFRIQICHWKGEENLQETALSGHEIPESISIDIQDFCMETKLQDMLQRERLLPADTG